MSSQRSIDQTSAPEVTQAGCRNENHGTANRVRFLSLFLLVCALCWQPDRAFSLSAGSEPASARDGAHDFDFDIGVWHTHIRRVPDPFSASSDVVEINGTVTVRPVWGGRANLEEIEADGPKGHWEGMSLFLYNPQSHQWSQTFLNSKFPAPSGFVGEFHDGRGELYQSDTFHDKSILVRAVWSEITPNSHRYTESFSNDGGKTWFLSFDAHKTREKDLPPSDMAAGAEPMSADPDGHAFDFDLGTWKTQSSRLMRPLTGSTTWADLEGQTVVQRVWGGRANLAEFVADGPAGHVQLLALRWFNPNTHEWNLDFATPNVGTLGEQPGVGQCKDGRCEFYDQEEVNGRQIWARFSTWKISEDSAQSEQAFSDDGGKTWEVNWINKYKRANYKVAGNTRCRDSVFNKMNSRNGPTQPERDDLTPVIRELISELAEYEKCPERVRTTEADISRDGFGTRSEFRVLIAEWQGVTAGFALFFNHYSTWRGAGLYFEDLFVRHQFRHRGIGIALIGGVARVAEQENRGFIRWVVLDWNQPAIALYAKIGANFLNEWRTVLLADESLKKLTKDMEIAGT